jgi:hypothetical protein|tara:strand:- start:1038 stop:1280 length:243 start_codon:yes stop_codon:yes gene_type:complete
MDKKRYDKKMEKKIDWKELIGGDNDTIIDPSTMDAIDRMHFIDGILNEYLSFSKSSDPQLAEFTEKYYTVLTELIQVYGH